MEGDGKGELEGGDEVAMMGSGGEEGFSEVGGKGEEGVVGGLWIQPRLLAQE